jgi:hypothetical protein
VHTQEGLQESFAIGNNAELYGVKTTIADARSKRPQDDCATSSSLGNLIASPLQDNCDLNHGHDKQLREDHC